MLFRSRKNRASLCWLLAESPRKCVFEPFCGKLDSQMKNEFASLTIFGPNAEIRMEKTSGQAVGWLRFLRADPAGEEFLARRSSALLRDGSGRHLLFDEYFKPDACGFLIRHCGRLCGVEDK